MRLLVVGAGGHAKVVADTARCAGFTIAGVVGDPGGRSELLGVPVSASADGIEADAFIAAIGDNAARSRAFAEYRSAGWTAASVIHPSAVIAEQVTVGSGTFIAAGVVVNIDARIGEDAILNTGCTIDHDCVVGDHALVGPTASMCGGALVGDGVLLGAGSSVIPTVSVGAWSVVGAGAAVVADVPERVVCAGVPARLVRGIEE